MLSSTQPQRGREENKTLRPHSPLRALLTGILRARRCVVSYVVMVVVVAVVALVLVVVIAVLSVWLCLCLRFVGVVMVSL